MERDAMERCVEEGQYIVRTGATVRAAALVFGVSKSTVHKDVTKRLWMVDRPLFRKVRAVLEYNKAQRHIRGGEATCRKYKNQKRPELKSPGRHSHRRPQ